MLSELNKLRPLFSRQDKWYYIGLLLMMMVGALLDVVGVGAVPAFVAALAVPEQVMAYPVVARILDRVGITDGRELVMWGCIALIVVFTLKNAYLAFVNFAQVRITEYHRVRLSGRLFAAYMRAPLEFHLAHNSAELLRNVNIETVELIKGIINPLLNIVMSAMMTLGIIVLIVATTPLVTVVGILIVGGGSWAFLRVFKSRLKRYGLEAKYERKESIKTINQGLGALVDARVLGREGYFIAAYRRSAAHFAYVDRLRQVIAKSSTPILETISLVGLVLIVFVLVFTGMDTVTMVPMLALFGAAIVRLRGSISSIVGGVSQMQYSVASISNVVDDLSALEEIAPRQFKKKGAKSKKGMERESLPFHHALRLNDVTYTYPETTQPALHGINMTINKGSSVAFVGATGSGKTTLINVILGLLQPQAGTIRLDEVNVSEHLPEWQAKIGFIPQTIFLLDDTIRRNIAFGLDDEDVDEDQLWKAARAAQLEAFIESLEEGFDTVVGERGVRLSGGQRQRIGLARALYHNPEVLIMDEATSSLDNHTESLVMEALVRLKEERTFIMIAHRLSTVQHCDHLYFLKDGRIEAEGTFDELNGTHREFQQMAKVA